ncbi:hypothetical protein P691DRAFT_500837 [Macrolepiota fuliginosa MF-IS2]|uniref:Uncharacterized protein n=1 Tax=Macrolepiota fuliginosa MF-IS2 TaxID=1400762 RepID=A0A9P6C6F4_9AGAR|nr:hypothetical protein P691DRAFT_500837 [Macrolepiota fuliginosa MF-IS2]
MSKPSAAQPPTNPSIPRHSAWSSVPPQSSNSPSRFQLPAPTTPTVQTHSRRPSALSGVSINDGVSVNRNSVPAAKQGLCGLFFSTPPLAKSCSFFAPGSAITFGSIDDVSAPSSSSPAAAPSIKCEDVKSFGTIEADSRVNGKSVFFSRPSVVVPPSTASSSTPSPAVSVAASAPAIRFAKTDIARLFQNPSSTPSSQPASSSQPTQSSAPSQPSQLGFHGFTPYRHPQSGALGAPPPQMRPPMAQQMPVPWSYYVSGHSSYLTINSLTEMMIHL